MISPRHSPPTRQGTRPGRPFCTIDEEEELIRRVTGTMKIIYDLGDTDTAACEVNVRRLVDFGWYAPIAKGETL